ncbi:MAG: formate dehydrogenase accessory protein FdhE [candidate division KSB1 bacterium]|nr:formate dehydrogenase accessory protein FdhE [candidate division KSB1 bacterium]MDZ7318558.1 formate dehydrogenase accessory protein FdhE [candidate division KSB1 bacterium]MDZ7342550.1 formate dehydrogenase accessory protein FdhE [candidate division KSB1 bacterium]
MIEKIESPPQVFGTYVKFHEQLFKIHVQCMEHLIAVLPFEKLNQINIADRLLQRQSVLTSADFIIDEKALEFVFDLIFPIIKHYSYRYKESIRRLEELYDKRKVSLRDLVSTLLSGDASKVMEISTQYDIPAVLMQQVVEAIGAPYVELCAEFLNKKISRFDWREPTCPICGNHPSMARVNEQSHNRWLWCRYCDTTWPFPEMTCPFCLSQDRKAIQLIFPSDKRPVRIDACNHCQHYLKTIDEMIDPEPVNMSVKHVATFYLDLLAKSRGYHLPNHFQFYLDLMEF